MDTSLISASQPILILGVLFGIVALGLWLEGQRWAAGVPGPVFIIVVSAALANLGFLPADSTTTETVSRVAPPIGIALLLLRANITEIVRYAGPVLGLYVIGALTSLVGVALAIALVPLGPDTLTLAAVKVASLLGGTPNVVAVSHSLAVPDAVFALFFSASSIVTSAYVAVAGLLAGNGWMRRRFGGGEREPQAPQAARAPAEQAPARKGLELRHIPLVLAYALVVYGLCDLVMRGFGLGQYTVIAISVVSLAVANLAPALVRRVSGDRELGMTALFMLSAALGANVDLSEVGRPMILMGIFVLVAVTVHLVLLLGIGRLLRARLIDLLIASMAGVGGPTTAAALAAGHDDGRLVTPAILAALLGYATATFAALAFYQASLVVT